MADEKEPKIPETPEAPTAKPQADPEAPTRAEILQGVLVNPEDVPKPPETPQAKRGRGRPPKATQAQPGKPQAAAPGALAKAPEKRPLTAQEVREILSPEKTMAWNVVTEQFTMMLAIMVNLLWPRMPMTVKDCEAHTRAWSVYLSVCPPTDLTTIAKFNLGFVYFVIFAPRLISSVRGFFTPKKTEEDKNADQELG